MPGVTKERNDAATDTGEPSLLIVARDQPELFRALEQEFEGSPQVLVILDERCADRRRQALAVPSDLRRRERRSPPRLEEDLRLRQYILVRPQARRPQD